MISDSVETVRTGVLFETNGFRPIWFDRSGSKIKITQIHYTWTERKADELLYKFSVTDGVHSYELQVSSRTMRWTVAAID